MSPAQIRLTQNSRKQQPRSVIKKKPDVGNTNVRRMQPPIVSADLRFPTRCVVLFVKAEFVAENALKAGIGFNGFDG